MKNICKYLSLSVVILRSLSLMFFSLFVGYLCFYICLSFSFPSSYLRPVQLSINILDAISVTTQSIPSINPSPVTAEHGMIPQCLVDISSKARNSLISQLFSDPLISCLLQKINKVAPTSFSCLSRLCNSFLQSSNLILSELSTTQISPSVDSKQFLQYERIVV